MWYLCGGDASGWKGQTSPSSISCSLPRASPGPGWVGRGWWPAVLTRYSQTIPAAWTRRALRFPARNQRRRRIGVRGSSCWTRCLTVGRSTQQKLKKGERYVSGNFLHRGSLKMKSWWLWQPCMSNVKAIVCVTPCLRWGLLTSSTAGHDSCSSLQLLHLKKNISWKGELVSATTLRFSLWAHLVT